MPNTSRAGIYYPAGSQDAFVAADMMEMADSIEPGLNLICEDAADRDDRFSDAPAGQIVTSVSGTQWVKVSSPPDVPVWKQVFSDSGLVTSGICEGRTGWTVTLQEGIIRAGWVWIQIRLTNDTETTITAGANGDIPNQRVVDMLGQWIPRRSAHGVLSDSTSGGTVYITGGSGQLWINSIAGGGISQGESMSISVVYPENR